MYSNTIQQFEYYPSLWYRYNPYTPNTNWYNFNYAYGHGYNGYHQNYWNGSFHHHFWKKNQAHHVKPANTKEIINKKHHEYQSHHGYPYGQGMISFPNYYNHNY